MAEEEVSGENMAVSAVTCGLGLPFLEKADSFLDGLKRGTGVRMTFGQGRGL